MVAPEHKSLMAFHAFVVPCSATPSQEEVAAAVSGTPVATEDAEAVEAEPVVEEPEDTSKTLDQYRAALAEKRVVRWTRPPGVVLSPPQPTRC